MDKNRLFRQEVIDSVKNKHYGSVYVNTPIPYSIVTICLCSLILGVLVYLTMADFAERYTVKGYLNSDKGVINVFPTEEGIITLSHVKQGQTVKKGDILYVINKTYDDLKKNHQRAELKQLLNRKTIIQQDIANKKIHLDALKPLLIKKYIPWQVYQTAADEISGLEQNLHQTNMAIIQEQRSRRYTIRAPISGLIANIMYQPGQYIKANKPLLHILPKNSHLIAQLYVPISKSGFLNPRDPLVIHYDAYPYQLFGNASARIQSIGKSILTDDDESKPIQINEPYYKLIASLDKQSISMDGKNRALQPGMTFSAVIVGVRKKIWQWILHWNRTS